MRTIVFLILLVIFTHVCNQSATAGTWEEYQSEARSSWAELRELSTRLSFKKSSTSAIDNAEPTETEELMVAIDGRRLYRERRVLDSSDSRAAVVGDGYGFLLQRSLSDAGWQIVSYGPNAGFVETTLGFQADQIRCPPLTPMSGASFEELIAADGVRVSSVERIERDGRPRISVIVEFDKTPVLVKGEHVSAIKMIHEFDPEMFWVQTRMEIQDDFGGSVHIAEYHLDAANRPLLVKVIGELVWTKSGTKQRTEEIYSDYKYTCDESVFLPETYGLPPLADYRTSSSNGLWLFAVVVALVSTGLVLRRRKSM